MAELITQQGIAPQIPSEVMPNVAPQTVPTVAPVVAEPDPSQQFDEAVDSRSPQKAMEVATRNIGTPVAIAAVKAADLMLKGEQAFKDMIAPVEKAGGIGTPQGNIAVAEQAKKYFQQDEPRMRDAFVYWLTGNSKMAQAMITGGDITKQIVTDNNGKLIKVSKNQLGDIVDVEDSLGRKLTKEEYDQRYVGRQKWEDTLAFKGQEQQQKSNIDALKASQEVNNAWASAAPEIESKSAQIYDDLAYLRSMNKGLGAKEYADVLKFASNSLGIADSASKGSSTLDQATQNRSANVGKSLTTEQTFNLGLGKDNKAGWRWTNKGIESSDGKQSISFDELKQKQSTENKSNELTQNFQQAQRNLFESKKFQQLNEGDQNRLKNILINSQQLAQKQLDLSNKHGTPTFMVLPSSVEIEDQYGLGQAKAIQGIFNAKALQLYSDYERKALAESGGIAPNPKELERGFTNTPQYKALLKEAKLSSDKVMDRPVQANVEVKFPNEARTPPRQINKESKTEGKAPPSLPPGVPKGSVKSGRVTPDGQPLWKAPDGSLHTED